MIKAFVNCLPYCDDCPYWETSYEEQVHNRFDNIQCREIRISCDKMAICQIIFDKEKEKRAAEEGTI